MPSDSKDLTQLMDAVKSIRQEMTRLADRVAQLEAAAPTAQPVEALKPSHSFTVTSNDPAAPKDGPSEEVLLAISAAVAQYLGVQPHIRPISLFGNVSWARQGRLTIQASHTLTK